MLKSAPIKRLETFVINQSKVQHDNLAFDCSPNKFHSFAADWFGPRVDVMITIFYDFRQFSAKN
jgi:hypothetical protein